MYKLIVTLCSLILLSSCFKTAEQIKREKQIDDQLSQSSRIIAELTSQVNELRGSVASTSGQIEELGHKSVQTKEEQQLTFSQSISQLAEQMKAVTAENTLLKSEVASLKEEQKNLRTYLNKVNSTLTSLGGGKSSSKKRGASKLQKAHKAFEANKLKDARQLYLELLSAKKSPINAAQRNHVYFNLGLMDYWDKNFNGSLVYFSKIYTKYPRSSFAPRSLLYIARSFGKLNKTDEANASYNELIQNYPKSKHAQTAKKEIK